MASILKDGMMTIEAALPTQGVEVHLLETTNIYLKNLKKAMTQSDPEWDEEFFLRPDCVAMLWLTLKENKSSTLENAIMIWVENSLIETIALDSCNYAWCLTNNIFVDPEISKDEFPDIEKWIKRFDLSVETVLESTTIKQIALELMRENNFYGKKSEELVKLLMFRVFVIHCDTYYGQGWPQDYFSETELVV